MKLVGNVKITDYMQNVRLQLLYSVVSLYSAHGEDILLLRSPHFRDGIRYKVSAENVLQVCIGGPFQDTLTIVLEEPPHKLQIYNHTFHLEQFVNLMRHLCEPIHVSQSVNSPGIPRKLDWLTRLPTDLTALNLHHIEMDSLPQSLERLHNLEQLDLVNCNLFEIPVFVGDLPNLSTLILSHNKLGAQQNWDFLSRPNIRQHLNMLDLQFNELQTVPNEVTQLEGLSVCLLDDNNITSLPTSLKEMQRLSVLTLSNNRMRILPYNIFPLNGCVLDLKENPITSVYFVRPNRPQKNYVETLKELASRAVVDCRLDVSFRNVPQVVVDYLKRVQFCHVCSGAYFDRPVPCHYIPTLRIYTEILPEEGHLTFESNILTLCSRRCMQPELKFCEVLNHLTPEQYDDLIKELL